MAPDFARVCASIIDTARMVLGMSGQNQVGLIRLIPGNTRMFTIVHPFTNDINTFQEWINASRPGGIGSYNRKAIAQAIDEARRYPWRIFNNDEIFYEKLVLIFTDNALHGYNDAFNDIDGDPRPMTNKFREENITLAVVGVVTSPLWYDIFYDNLAQSTGGDDIPMIRFENQFGNILNMVANDGDTFRQALLRT